MKKVIVLLLICSLATPVLAQENSKVGFFGAPLIKLSQLNKKFGYMPGGRVGVIVKLGQNNLIIGGSGYYLVNDINAKHIPAINYELAYGGLDVEYLIPVPEKERLYLSVSLLGGAGKLSYDASNVTSPAIRGIWEGAEDGIYIIEPSVNILVDDKSYSRWRFGVGYRIVTGIDNAGVSASDISGPSINISFQLGVF